MKFNNILLVSSDEFGIKDIKEALREHEVFIIDDPDKAAGICDKQDIYLVIIEEELPGKKGTKLFQQLRDKRPWMAGLLLTSKADEKLLRLALDIGFSGLLEKPINALELLKRIYEAKESARRQEENTRLRTLLPLYSFGERFLASTTEQEIFDGLVDIVARETKAPRISVMWYNQEEKCLRVVASLGIEKDVADSIRLQPGDQVAGWVYLKGKPVILNRGSQDESTFAPLLQRRDISAAVSFPISLQGEVKGVLNISQSEEEATFSEADIELLAVICSQTAMSLANLQFRKVLQEKTRVRTLFEQYVAPEVAELLIRKGENLVGLGEIKNATVFFADIRESTTLVERLELTELRSFLNEFFQIFTDTIFRNHGTIDKFMGDAVLAVFGAPIALDNPNLTAIRTAMEIREEFEKLRLKWIARREDYSIVNLAIGVTCGDVFLGNVGTSKRFDYTVIGTQVNVAQRIAAATPEGHIHITEDVKQHIEPYFEITQVGSMRLRGLQKLVSVYSVTKQQDLSDPQEEKAR